MRGHKVAFSERVALRAMRLPRPPSKILAPSLPVQVSRVDAATVLTVVAALTLATFNSTVVAEVSRVKSVPVHLRRDHQGHPVS